MVLPLSPEERTTALKSLLLWTYDPSRLALHRQIRFSTFPQALSAMVAIGFEAERMDHHPEWSNVYDRLDIWLTTHDAGDVSEKDVRLALCIDALVD